jgi:hypothetical protein
LNTHLKRLCMGGALAAVGLIVWWGVMKTPGAPEASLRAPASEALSADMVQEVMQKGTPVSPLKPSGDLLPDGYDEQVYEYRGERYLISVGGLTGQHQMGRRLPP